MFKNDLKKSSLARKYLGDDGYFNLLAAWYSLLAKVAIEHGGEVLFEAGDSIAVFFDNEAPGRDSMENIWRCVSTMLAQHHVIEKQFELPFRLNMRASVTFGELKPVWKPTAGQQLAGYKGNVLVDSERIMETERDLPDTSAEISVLMIEENDIFRSSSLAWLQTVRTLRRNLHLYDKDKVERTLAAFAIEAPMDKENASPAGLGESA